MAAGVDHEDQMRKTTVHIQMDKEMTMTKTDGYAQNIESVAGIYSRSPDFSISPGNEDSKDDSADPGTARVRPERAGLNIGSLSQIKEQISEKFESEKQPNQITFVDNNAKVFGKVSG